MNGEFSLEFFFHKCRGFFPQGDVVFDRYTERLGLLFGFVGVAVIRFG